MTVNVEPIVMKHGWGTVQGIVRQYDPVGQLAW
jgi:hypothetical protein